MLRIFNIRERQEYLKEVAELTQKEWGKKGISEEEFDAKVNKKIEKIIQNFDNPLYCKLILLDDDKLVGFISIFPHDGDERKEYRGNGYSKILNNAILSEARKRGFRKLYLKTDLVNYYEKFGAVYLDELRNGEKLYCIEVG